jgi:hypothetical protein
MSSLFIVTLLYNRKSGLSSPKKCTIFICQLKNKSKISNMHLKVSFPSLIFASINILKYRVKTTTFKDNLIYGQR